MANHSCIYTACFTTPAALKDWQRYLVPEAGRWRDQTVLEVGVFEGRSAVWFLDHVLPLSDTHYVGIDPWGTSRRGHKAEQRCRTNLAPRREKVVLHKGRAEDVLPGLDLTVHLAYIDAARDYDSVLAYSELVWPKVPPDGLVVWSCYRDSHHLEVATAVDDFLATRHYDTVWVRDQLCVRKVP